MLKVGMLADFMGDVEEDYADMESLIARLLPEETFTFTRDLQPHEAHDKAIDIFIFDFGGLAPGATGLLESMVKQLYNMLTEQLPGCMLVFWTTFTANLVDTYPEQMEMEAAEFYKLPNVAVAPNIYADNINKARWAIQKIRTWQGLETSDSFLTTVAGRDTTPGEINDEYAR